MGRIDAQVAAQRCASRAHSSQSGCAEAPGNPHLELRSGPPRTPEGRPASAQLLRPSRRRPLSGSLSKNHGVRPTWQGALFPSTSQARSESQGLRPFLYSPAAVQSRRPRSGGLLSTREERVEAAGGRRSTDARQVVGGLVAGDWRPWLSQAASGGLSAKLRGRERPVGKV